MLQRLLICLALLLVPAVAQARGIEPELVGEGPAAPGGEVEIAIHMRPAAGWHGYWVNPGDAGLPMDVQWQLPKGFSAGPLRYPVPTRLKIADLMNYVYERDYAVLVRMKVPADARGAVPIRAEAHWLACTDKVCVPEQGELSLDLPVGTGTPNRAQFDAWRRLLPQPLASVGKFEIAGNKLRVAIPLPASVEVRDPYVFPVIDGSVDYNARQTFRRAGDTLIAELLLKGAAPSKFPAVVALGNGRALELQAIVGPVPEGKPIGGLGWSAILWAVFGAILGGILLNLMPCVFPILALKALHLSRAGGAANEARSDALAYTAGSVVGTGALGAVLLAVRAAGTQAGWAFQLQDPRTIMLLLLLAVAITLNLLRAYELPAVGGAKMMSGSFGTGVLAAFVATPCAGPFLGVALGTALLLPLAGSVLVFGALGLGLAMPFLFIAFVPALRTMLPKPGAWMARLQRFLAIPMAATAVACIWLLWRLGGAKMLEVALVSTAVFTLMIVGAGLMQRKGKETGYVATLLAIAVAGASMWALSTVSLKSQALAGRSAWSEEKLEIALTYKHPVFVYFTADWCLSCKVNEATSIDRAEVREAFGRAGVTVLAGDWTNGDPAITRFLESQGRAGVPLYLWYVPGKPPVQLPQVLTPSMLISRAQQAQQQR
jgi:DsbC/DsbD-like thiol-disulfide interchange protein/cytochrome c biogenesis protein CcdA